MPLFKFHSLKLPNASISAFSSKINDTENLAGVCYFALGTAKAATWDPLGNVTLLNLPGQLSSYAFDLNAKGNVVGSFNNNSFFWEKSTGTMTILKAFDGNPTLRGYMGGARAINDLDQITGSVSLTGNALNPENLALWTTPNSIPLNLTSGVNLGPYSHSGGTDINKNGVIVGNVGNFGYYLGFSNHGFIEDGINWQFFLDSSLTGNPVYEARAVNDLVPPQIVGTLGGNYVPPGTVPSDSFAFMYDSQTGSLQILSLPGESGQALDINNKGDIVGVVNGSSPFPTPNNAVMWTLNGLVKVDLNHPTISDAAVKGWHLSDATSINNNGSITGLASLISDPDATRPYVLTPAIPVRKIKVEYMLPHILWPGEAYDGPRPKGWPVHIPFPIPSPNPFQIVGRGTVALNNVLACKNLNETLSNLRDEKDRKEMGAIITRILKREMNKLKNILANSSSLGKKGK